MIKLAALNALERRYRKRIRQMYYEMDKVMNEVPKSAWSDVAPNFHRYISMEEVKLDWIEKRKKNYGKR